jgi:hypothetical protein
MALAGPGPENLVHVPSAWPRRCNDAAGRCGSGFSVANLAASILIPGRQKSLSCLAGRAYSGTTGRIEEWPICRILYDVALCVLLFGRIEVSGTNDHLPQHGRASRPLLVSTATPQQSPIPRGFWRFSKRNMKVNVAVANR